MTCIVRDSDCMGYPFSCSTSCTNAFFQYSFTQHNLAEISAGEMGLHHTKLEEMSRLAVILQKDYVKAPRSRRNVQSIPPIMKNERSKPNNPTETRAIPARTQIAKPNSELGINDSTGYRIPILSQARGSLHFPAAADPPG